MNEADIQRALDAVKVGGPWRRHPRTTKEPWVGVAIAGAMNLDLMDKRAHREVLKLVNKLIQAGKLRVVTRNDDHREPREYVEVAGNHTTM
jgi:hypothetical protein